MMQLNEVRFLTRLRIYSLFGGALPLQAPGLTPPRYTRKGVSMPSTLVLIG